MAHDPITEADRCLLHVFATFDPGGPQVRTAGLIGALPASWRHLIIAADGRTGATGLLPSNRDATVVASPRRQDTLRMLRAWRRVADEHEPDLVLTYNWGAIEAAFAARWQRRPFIHHEETLAFGERALAKLRRRIARRLLLRSAAAVVVPSRRMHRIAEREWKLAPPRLRYIANGIDLTNRRPRARRPGGPLVIGTVAHFRPEKNIARLIRAFAALPEPDARLHLAGDGPTRADCEQLAAEMGIAERVRFLGHQEMTAPTYQGLDVFVLTSDDEQMPTTVLEAMAHGLPIVATDVGDVAAMLPPAQRPWVVTPTTAVAARLADHLADLCASPRTRAELGSTNRAWAARRHSFVEMVGHYLQLYEQAMGRSTTSQEPCS